MAWVPSFVQKELSHHLRITQEDTFCGTNGLPVDWAQLFVALAHVFVESKVGGEEDYVRNVDSGIDRIMYLTLMQIGIEIFLLESRARKCKLFSIALVSK